MTLSLIQSAIASQTRGMSADAWIRDETLQAEKVALMRRYRDGDHRANLTPEMRKALRINSGSLNEFNDNYCPVIIDTMVDRLKLDRVASDNQAMDTWIANLTRDNRLDTLQDDIHGATVGDGDSYLIVDAYTTPDGRTRARFTHEPAFDGNYGIIPFYARSGDSTPLFAVRVWRESTETMADTVRVNVYYADRIERFVSVSGASMTRYDGDGQEWQVPWTQASGDPIGVPVVPFKNRPSAYSNHGISEIENIIPMQDVLNRTLYSMTMMAELTAFPVRVLIGDRAPDGLTPGMFLSYYAKDKDGNPVPPTQQILEWLKAVRIEQYQQGELVPYIEQAKWLKSEIFAISNTPDEGAADNSSGESLKQREVKLIGKVERFQTHNGNAWEDSIALAHRVESAFGDEPPAYTTLTAKWQPAMLRNDAEVIKNALDVAKQVDQRTFLELVAPVFDWDKAKIDAILQAAQTQREMEVRNAARGFADSVFGEEDDSDGADTPPQNAA